MNKEFEQGWYTAVAHGYQIPELEGMKLCCKAAYKAGLDRAARIVRDFEADPHSGEGYFEQMETVIREEIKQDMPSDDQNAV